MVSFGVTLILLAVIAGFIITLVTHTYWLSLIIAGCIILILESFFGVIELKKQESGRFYFRSLTESLVYVSSFSE